MIDISPYLNARDAELREILAAALRDVANQVAEEVCEQSVDRMMAALGKSDEGTREALYRTTRGYVDALLDRRFIELATLIRRLGARDHTA